MGKRNLPICQLQPACAGGLLYTLPLEKTLPGTRIEGAGIVYAFTFAPWRLSGAGGQPACAAGTHGAPRRLNEGGAGGFRYVWRGSAAAGGDSLDLFVVLLGGAVALMPIFASDILHTGPRGLGMLRAAPAGGRAGDVAADGALPDRAAVRGNACSVAVGIFGAATVIFGLSRNLWLSLVALAVGGAADMISVIIRGSLLQLATPPEMRGRVSAVNSLFIGASNELGEFESGLTAQWWGAVRATLVGGLGALVVAGAWATLFPDCATPTNSAAEAPETVRDFPPVVMSEIAWPSGKEM